jgi:hypothetical protein
MQRTPAFGFTAFILGMLLSAVTWGKTCYVDNAAGGSTHNGTSWATAWTSPGAISGVTAGDTVYISGGTAGNTQTYNMPVYWNPPNGASGNPVTYRIGQDASHNGTAVFNLTGAPGGNPWLTGSRYITVSGDAGDGARHIKCTGYATGVTNCSAGVMVSYVDFTSGVGQLVGMGGLLVSSFTIDHVSARLNDLNGSTAIAVNAAADTWDAIVISNCDLQLPHIAATGFGYDGVACNRSFTYKNNVVRSYEAAGYSGGQHQDGWQTLGPGSKIKIYGNTFIDMCNYGTYGEAIGGGFTDIYIYNNLFIISDPAVSGPMGVVFGPQASYSGPLPCTFARVIIANNTFVDYGTHTAIALNNVSPVSSAWENCIIANNISCICS